MYPTRMKTEVKIMYEKEIKALFLCSQSNTDLCKKCPYKGNECVIRLMKTARNIIRLFDDKIAKGHVKNL